ncbi:MAG: hypothetical protein ACOYI5_10480, partial [Christensenellales bacterium]
PDDAYPDRFQKSAYKKPALAAKIREITTTVDAFFAFLAEAGEAGEAREDALSLPADFIIPDVHARAMAAFGLRYEDGAITSEKWPGMFRAWKMLCPPCETALDRARRTARMEKCAFVENSPGLKGAFHRLMGEETEVLTRWLEAHGYRRESLILDGQITALRYLKDGRGVQFLYDPQVRVPACMALVSRAWRELLPGYPGMAPSMQAFILKNNKQCNGCAACVQKSAGRAKPQAVVVEHNGARIPLCPMPQRGSYVFEKIDAQTVGDIVACLRYMQTALPAAAREESADDIGMFRI